MEYGINTKRRFFKRRFFKYSTFNIPNSKFQSGQTLMETIIAIFILLTALVGGISLAFSTLASTNLDQQKIIATNLAREGLDVARMMRDSNWLAADGAAGGFNLSNCNINGVTTLCYPKVFDGPTPGFDFNINSHPSYDNSTRAKKLLFDGANWTMQVVPSLSSNYNLYFDPATGFYAHTSTSVPSVFARQVLVSFNQDSPYHSTHPEMIVKVVVAFRNKTCSFDTSVNL